ncbi:hypothetical protein LXL04_025504 [Taraxacum kok-saghyz]
MSYDNGNITTLDVRWLGIRSSDFDKHKIPNEVRVQMTPQEIKVLDRLLEEEFVICKPQWFEELTRMNETKQKVEIQALNCFGMDYLANVYLPRKLQTEDWIRGVVRLPLSSAMAIEFEEYIVIISTLDGSQSINGKTGKFEPVGDLMHDTCYEEDFSSNISKIFPNRSRLYRKLRSSNCLRTRSGTKMPYMTGFCGKVRGQDYYFKILFCAKFKCTYTKEYDQILLKEKFITCSLDSDSTNSKALITYSVLSIITTAVEENVVLTQRDVFYMNTALSESNIIRIP